MAWQDAKAAAKLHLGERSPRRGLLWLLFKSQVRITRRIRTLLLQKFIWKFMQEKLRVANLFPDEILKF